jgi:hypothetical protein
LFAYVTPNITRLRVLIKRDLRKFVLQHARKPPQSHNDKFNLGRKVNLDSRLNLNPNFTPNFNLNRNNLTNNKRTP